MVKNLAQQAKEKITPILSAIDALDQRWNALGTEKAFDLHDPETNRLFRDLWKVTFDKNFSLELQNEMMRQMQTFHLPKLRRMREISVASEIELEKGCAQDAIRATDAGEQKFTHIRDLRNRWKHAEAAGDAGAAKVAREELIEAQIKAFYQLLKRYPYKTYPSLLRNEMQMVAALDGLDERTQSQGTHLVIEAGAIPFTAVLSSILRGDGESLGTIADPKTLEISRQFIDRLERLEVLEPHKVRVIRASKDTLGFVELTNTQGQNVKPYLATITQVTKGKGEAEAAIHVLKDRGIDTVMGRGAHGLARLLYEPLDDLLLPAKFQTHAYAVPKVGSQVVCYNSSHLFSSRALMNLPTESPTHTFQKASEQQYRA